MTQEVRAWEVEVRREDCSRDEGGSHFGYEEGAVCMIWEVMPCSNDWG